MPSNAPSLLVSVSLADDTSRLEPDTASNSTSHAQTSATAGSDSLVSRVANAMTGVASGIQEIATEETVPDWVYSGEPKRNILPGFRSDKLLNRRAIIAAVLNLIIYLAVSIAVMRALEPSWTTIDAAYFCMATMSTVGCALLLSHACAPRPPMPYAACRTHLHRHSISHAHTPPACLWRVLLRWRHLPKQLGLPSLCRRHDCHRRRLCLLLRGWRCHDDYRAIYPEGVRGSEPEQRAVRARVLVRVRAGVKVSAYTSRVSAGCPGCV